MAQSNTPLKVTEQAYEKRYKSMRSDYTAETGKKLGSRQTSGTGPRRVSFACRFGGMKGGLTDKSGGGPSNLSKALKKWGFANKAEATSFCNSNKKS